MTTDPSSCLNVGDHAYQYCEGGQEKGAGPDDGPEDAMGHQSTRVRVSRGYQAHSSHCIEADQELIGCLQ